MKRRDFLKTGSLAVTAAAIGSLPLGNIYSKTGSSFSLEVITGNEEKAIKLIENFIKEQGLNSGIVKFSEYSIGNAESGDIVLLQNSKLINYKESTGKLSEGLRVIATELGLPGIVLEPVRLRFYSETENESAKHFLVFNGDMLVNKINASEENINLILNGNKGGLTLNIHGKKARVVKSACTHKNCINTGSISLAGESIVCIPNNILIIAE